MKGLYIAVYVSVVTAIAVTGVIQFRFSTVAYTTCINYTHRKIAIDDTVEAFEHSASKIKMNLFNEKSIKVM